MSDLQKQVKFCFSILTSLYFIFRGVYTHLPLIHHKFCFFKRVVGKNILLIQVRLFWFNHWIQLMRFIKKNKHKLSRHKTRIAHACHCYSTSYSINKLLCLLNTQGGINSLDKRANIYRTIFSKYFFPHHFICHAMLFFFV